MTTQSYPESAEARAHGKRAHLRRKLSPMAYVELGQDNGGILLNLSEGGFAVQSALMLTSKEFSELRFQIPAFQGWLTAKGRIIWMSDSKKEAGIQFTELPEEARREIYKWVSTENEPAKASARFPIPARGSRPPTVRDVDQHSGGAANAREPGMTVGAEMSAGPTQRETLRINQSERPSVAVAEPPTQDFRFTEYSMFAPDLEKEAVWAEPARRRGNWGRGALLGVLVAALFFALGATVGRGTVDEWMAALGNLTQKQLGSTPPPKVSVPAPPGTSASGEAAENGSEKVAGTELGKGNEDEGTSAASSGNPTVDKGASAEGKEKSRDERSGTEARDTGVTAPPNRVAPSNKDLKTRTREEMAAARNDGEAERVSSGHSILVNAPRLGSRPFYVNLPSEAISASPTIAMSVRRTLEIPPNAAGGSERVMIGKLISHSEPFYPVEARRQHLEGSVELRARVGRTGQVIGLTPVSGPGLLTSAAATAVREWRYEPTFIDGDPTETIADITVVFRLP